MGLSLLEAVKVSKRLELVLRAIEDVKSDRLIAFLEEQGRQPMEDSEIAMAREESFKRGLKAGLGISKIELADLDAELMCEAFNGNIDDVTDDV